MQTYKKRISFFVVAAATTVLLIGCGEKKEDNNTAQNTKRVVATKQTAPKIEIVENTSKNEIKVKEEKSKVSSSKNSDSFYYDYDKKEKTEEKERTVLDAYTHIRSPYERVRVSLLQRQLSTTFRLKCSPCHDDYANGVIGPSLLGKSEQYIYDKIIAFKTGKKSNPLMSDLLKKMDDTQIKQIAKEIYTFNQEVQKMREKIRKDAK